MKHRHLPHLLLPLLLALLLAVAACTQAPQPARTSQPADSLYSEAAVMAVYEKNPEEALRRIDSAEALGRLHDFRAARYHGLTSLSPTDEQWRDDYTDFYGAQATAFAADAYAHFGDTAAAHSRLRRA